MARKKIPDKKRKVVSKPSHSLTLKPIGCLLLNDLDPAEVVVGTPALNSSGDIYHVIAYLCLSQSMKHKFPHLLFMYDTEDTKVHVQRAQELVRLCNFEPIATTSIQRKSDSADGKWRSYQPNSRMASLRLHCAKQTTLIYLIDQKATTLFISKLCLQHGYATITECILQILCHNAMEMLSLHPKIKTEMDRWIEQQLNRITKAAEGKCIVILNQRYSAGANSDQNFSEKELEALKAILEAKKLFLWHFVAGEKTTFTPVEATFLFSKDSSIDSEGPVKRPDFYKLRHWLLLARLKSLDNFIGMIGNTSGTLDAAAFVGIPVYNIHRFQERDPLILDAQDFRILLQHTFMRIGLPLLPQGSMPHDKDGIALNTWLDKPTPGLPLTLPNFIVTQKPFHTDRLPFSAYLTWKRPEDSRTFSSSTQLSLASSPYATAYPFFKPTADDIEKAVKERRFVSPARQPSTTPALRSAATD